METLYTLKVYPLGLGREIYRVIEICGRDTLDDLCMAILEAFDFYHEHLYEFCMDCKMYSDSSYQYQPMEEDDLSTDIALDDLHLTEKQKFMLHYDFGDDWQFIITVQKASETKGYTKPKIVKRKGSVEQYPDWDDEFEEDD